MASLKIRIDRQNPNGVLAPDEFETTSDFAIEINNGGEPVHVHVNGDDEVMAGISFETGNHFVPSDQTYRIPVDVNEARRPFSGKLRVSTGFGASKEYVDIHVTEPVEEEKVAVDERLAQPMARPRRRRERPIDRVFTDVGLVAAVVVALLILLVIAIVVAVRTTPFVGLLLIIVVLLLVTAGYLVIEEIVER